MSDSAANRIDGTRIWPWLCFILLLFIFVYSRVLGVGAQSYWLDEMVSIHFAGHSLWKALLWDNHPPLHHFILKLWMAVFGQSEISTRGLSVVFSTLSFVLIYRFASQRLHLKHTVLVALLFTLFAPQIEMAHEARMYALFELFAIINAVAFLKLMNTKSNSQNIFQARGLWLASLIGLCATHYFGVVILAIQATIRASTLNERRWLVLIVGGVTTFVGLTVVFLIDWNFLRWQEQSFTTLASFAMIPRQLFEFSPVVLLPLYFFKTKRSSENPSFSELYLLLGPLFFGLAFVLASFVLQRNFMFVRYFEFLFPLTLMGLVLKLAHEDSQAWLRNGILALITLGAVGFSTPRAYDLSKAPWRDAADFMAKDPAPVFTSGSTAIQSPYFTQRGLVVHKLTNATEQVESVQNLWIIESYARGMAGFSYLKTNLPAETFDLETFKFQKGNSDAVVVLRVRRK